MSCRLRQGRSYGWSADHKTGESMKKLLIVTSLAVTACSSPAPAPAGQEQATVGATDQAERAAPSAAAIEAAKAALAKEPQIKDMIYKAAETVQWNIGVSDDGTSRVGYAEYVCTILEEHDALAGRTHVRIVDIAKVANGKDFRDASLGHVICETGDVIDT